MRGLKIAVALLAVWSITLTVLGFAIRRDSRRSLESLDELTDMLQIRRWEVPMPNDTRYEWSFEIENYKAYNEVETGMTEWMDSSRRAKIVFMPTGDESIYRFWFVQTNGTSSGKTRLDVCDFPNDIHRECKAAQWELTWYSKPKRIEDGKSYLIGEISDDFQPLGRKQIVLHLVRFRDEDVVQAAEHNSSQVEYVEEGDVGYPLKGRIRLTNTGHPASGMLVECFIEGWKRKIAKTTTDASGNFSFPDLPEGQYYLKASGRNLFTIKSVVTTSKKSINVLSLIEEACDSDLATGQGSCRQD
jgi:hypothetical protein